ncbi:enoyl-CoA hydratase/isomerase family protein [Salirhabdus sp. Marseille-P4669]|uniref:enoyl-CoA hydratase/isomerase family protein n=1 Tax=Salirhabdus sp. Marseille-P4669 TaxID=2042310 RepID=UPI000C7B8320|nr:enoyl-CoA hydratase-related protein [Salirhabdus sp. Marseille-P4669]
MSNWETLALSQDEKTKGVYLLTLNRPNAMNALNTKMGMELIECLRLLHEKDDLRVLILTGSGERSFCVGADLKERNGMTNEDWHRQHDIFEEAYGMIRDFPFPVLVAVNGYALGGGLEMVLSCDLRIFAEHASVGVPEVKIGLIPGVGGTQLLPRTIPVGIAKELLFRGHFMSAKRAEAIGLANYVVEGGDLMEEAFELARDIAKNAPLSLKALKYAVNNGIETDLHAALEIELDQYYKCANSEDRVEGIRAFNEKRQAEWKGK